MQVENPFPKALMPPASWLVETSAVIRRAALPICSGCPSGITKFHVKTLPASISLAAKHW